mmetsp:Transcript_3138/g.9716  ORF Transcript_3138/g.9716 Transcript_3138/m.9716 type:complete len:266 (+) Transcript_3138:378-1175(+)
MPAACAVRAPCSPPSNNTSVLDAEGGKHELERRAIPRELHHALLEVHPPLRCHGCCCGVGAARLAGTCRVCAARCLSAAHEGGAAACEAHGLRFAHRHKANQQRRRAQRRRCVVAAGACAARAGTVLPRALGAPLADVQRVALAPRPLLRLAPRLRHVVRLLLVLGHDVPHLLVGALTAHALDGAHRLAAAGSHVDLSLLPLGHALPARAADPLQRRARRRRVERAHLVDGQQVAPLHVGDVVVHKPVLEWVARWQAVHLHHLVV